MKREALKYIISSYYSQYENLPQDIYKDFLRENFLNPNTVLTEKLHQKQRLYLSALLFFYFIYFKASPMNQAMLLQFLKQEGVLNALKNIKGYEVIPPNFRQADLTSDKQKIEFPEQYVKAVERLCKAFDVKENPGYSTPLLPPEDLLYYIQSGTSSNTWQYYASTFSFNIHKESTHDIFFFTVDRDKIIDWGFEQLESFGLPSKKELKALFCYIPTYTQNNFDSMYQNLEALIDSKIKSIDDFTGMFLKIAYSEHKRTSEDEDDESDEINKEKYAKWFYYSLTLPLIYRVNRIDTFIKILINGKVGEEYTEGLLRKMQVYSDILSPDEDFKEKLQTIHKHPIETKEDVLKMLEKAPLFVYDIVEYGNMLTEAFFKFNKLLLSKIGIDYDKQVLLTFTSFSTFLSQKPTIPTDLLNILVEHYDWAKQYKDNKIIIYDYLNEGKFKTVTEDLVGFSRYLAMYLFTNERKLISLISDIEDIPTLKKIFDDPSNIENTVSLSLTSKK